MSFFWNGRERQMITILICDDDSKFAEFEKETIGAAAKRYGQEIWTEFYEDGKSLIQAVEEMDKTNLCILLLDIDMPELTGYDVAGILNEKYSDMLILFVSARDELVYEAFEYRPFRFIRKSHFELEIRHALRKAFEVLERRMEKQTIVASKGEKVLVSHGDILYLLMLSRKLCIYQKDGRVLEVRNTMKAMLAELNDKKLIQINSGCAVNVDYVVSYTADTVVMKNGEKLPISRGRAKEVKLEIEKGWRK
jgi:DNA-binding LytR/AlgR family response regulator